MFLKNLFNKENTMKVDISQLSKALKGYDFITTADSKKFMIKKSYIIGGQEMRRAYVEVIKDELIILDGWGGRVIKTSVEKLTRDLNRLFEGEFAGGLAVRVYTTKSGATAVY